MELIWVHWNWCVEEMKCAPFVNHRSHVTWRLDHIQIWVDSYPSSWYIHVMNMDAFKSMHVSYCMLCSSHDISLYIFDVLKYQWCMWWQVMVCVECNPREVVCDACIRMQTAMPNVVCADDDFTQKAIEDLDLVSYHSNTWFMYWFTWNLFLSTLGTSFVITSRAFKHDAITSWNHINIQITLQTYHHQHSYHTQ